jgi:HEAT repeat protein
MKLGIIKDKQAIAPLAQALVCEDPKVRLIAALSLGKLADPPAIDPAIQALTDDDVYQLI